MSDTEPSRQAHPNAASTTTATATAGRREPPGLSELAPHADRSPAPGNASAHGAAEASAAAQRGVVWVRPSELMRTATARAAGRGIDVHAELTRRARARMRQAVAPSRRAISERARRLPPVTAFGRRSTAWAGATRSGIGLR